MITPAPPPPAAGNDRPRALFYSADVTGLGNIRRTIALAWRLHALRPRAALLGVTGSLLADAFSLPPSFDFVKIPNASRQELYRELAADPATGLAGFWAMRARLITETADAFRPHLVVIDTFPSGIEGEVRVALERLHRSRPRPRIVLGLRDVIEPEAQARAWWRRLGAYELLDEVFDDILVYGSPALYDHRAVLGFSDIAAAKTAFCGYLRADEPIAPPGPIRARYGAAAKPLVVVAIGGGEFGHYLLLAYLEALRAGLLPDIASCLVTGPLMLPQSRARVEEAAAGLPDLHLVEFAGEPLGLYAAADALVTMGGITMVEAVGLGVRVVSAPYRMKLDQVERGRRFAEHGLATYVDPETFSAAPLAAAIRRSLAGPPPPPILPFDGLDIAGPYLANLLSS